MDAIQTTKAAERRADVHPPLNLKAAVIIGGMALAISSIIGLTAIMLTEMLDSMLRGM